MVIVLIRKYYGGSSHSNEIGMLCTPIKSIAAILH